MNNTETDVSRFRGIANKLLREQVAELKKARDSSLVVGKLAKLQAFNTHLYTFRKELNTQLKLILDESQAPAKDMLSAELNKVLEEYINEYMYHGFSREEG